MSIDVEDYFHVSAMSKSIDRQQWDDMPSRVERNTSRLLDLFDEFETRATFFVLGWVAQRFPGLVREIRQRGHEVASHGMSHKLIYKQSRAEFEQETRTAKHLLEDITGAPVIGYRAASFSIIEDSLWALDVLEELGFSYDSSVFPVRRDLYGIPSAPRWPYRRETPAGRQIVEFPPTSFEALGMRIPASGGGFFRIYPYQVTRSIMRHTNRRLQHPCMFYLHPWEVDPDQPRIRASLKSRIRHYTNLSRVENRMRRLLNDFHFASVSDVLRDLSFLEPTKDAA